MRAAEATAVVGWEAEAEMGEAEVTGVVTEEEAMALGKEVMMEARRAAAALASSAGTRCRSRARC